MPEEEALGFIEAYDEIVTPKKIRKYVVKGK